MTLSRPNQEGKAGHLDVVVPLGVYETESRPAGPFAGICPNTIATESYKSTRASERKPNGHTIERYAPISRQSNTERNLAHNKSGRREAPDHEA